MTIMKETLKQEVARDLIALGSIPFYAIVIIRMLLAEEFSLLVPQLIIAAFIIILAATAITFNKHLARGFVLVAFTSLGYKETIFTIFASFLWILIIIALNYLKVKRSEIIKGAVIGIISAAISHVVTETLF